MKYQVKLSKKYKYIPALWKLPMKYIHIPELLGVVSYTIVDPEPIQRKYHYPLYYEIMK